MTPVLKVINGDRLGAARLCTWALLLCMGTVPVTSDAAPRSPRPPARVAHSDASRLVFSVQADDAHTVASTHVPGAVRVTIPGYATTGLAGEPALPRRKLFVGLPPSGSYTMSHRVVSSRPLGTHRVEPAPFLEAQRHEQLGATPVERFAIGDAYQAATARPMVETGAVSYIRRNRVLPLYVNPVSYDVASGRISVATEIEVTVTFRPERGADATTGRPPEPESELWEGMFSRLIVNAGQARRWRMPRRRAPTATAPSPAAAGGALVRLEVRETGIHKVTASTLIQAGFPSGQALASLQLFQRTYDEVSLTPGSNDIAFHVKESGGGTPGIFDGADLLLFYGRRLRDDGAQGDTIEKFADHNVYWLGNTGGTMMNNRTLAAGTVGPDTATAAFPVSRRFEVDNFFWEFSTPQAGPDFYLYNLGSEPGPVEAPLELNAIKPGTTMLLRAELHGRIYKAPRAVRLRLSNTLGTTVLNDLFFLSNRDVRVFQANVDASALTVGTNRFVLRHDGTRSTVDALINWVTVAYQALFRARNNSLRFNTLQLSGASTSVTVTGLARTDLWLFDITSPDTPVLCDVTAGLFTDVPGGKALSFLDDADANRSYLLLPESEMIALTGDDVTRDTASAIIGSSAENGVDVLVISHRLFLAQMQEWVSFRESQGYRVHMVDVEDVYDEFNNGIPGARAVDRFVRHFYELGGASVLLLVGDASEDNKGIEESSPPNYVPTRSRGEHVGGGGFNDDEVVTTDKLYTRMPGPGGIVDDEFDLIVGRIPVGAVTELARVLFKTLKYERPSGDETWRRRVLVIADDDYSEGGSSVFGGLPFCENPLESGFQVSQERVATKFENAAPDFDVVRIYLKNLLTAIHTEDCINRQTAIVYTRENANPVLMNELNQGASLVFIQAHMNRSQVGHEMFFTTVSSNILGTTVPARDHLRLENTGKPFIMWGLGCHFSDYALHKEEFFSRTTLNNPNGDSFAEQLLFQSDRAAVGVLGSTGFEYLNQTNAYMERTADVWLYEAPYDNLPQQTQARWIFGQMTLLTELTLAVVQRGPTERYHILGDPLLNVEAGPPGFTVTVDGQPVSAGDVLRSTSEGDTVEVVAVISDENAIHDFELEIAGVDTSQSLTRTPLVDQTLSAARQYRVSFRHKLRAEAYNVVLRALQTPDTSGQYQIASEFLLTVPADISVSVNGRSIRDGDIVAARGNYEVDVNFAVFIPQSQIGVSIDDNPIAGIEFSHPNPPDTTSWRLRFNQQLSGGAHVLDVTVGSNQFSFTLEVGTDPGVRNVLNYPNPFTDTTNFIFTNDVQITEGEVRIYTTSGRRIRTITIPPDAMIPGQNAVFWDGRDQWGNELANGVYLYMIRVMQSGKWYDKTEKLARMR